MRKQGTYFLFLTLSLLIQTENLIAQNGRQKIAVFVPLYLDSAFDETNTYRFEKVFPKFLNPGLEFYEGIQLALDSLSKEKTQLEVFVFDTRSSKTLLQEQLNALDSVGLIIAHASAQENWVLADEARLRKVPYINVNLPNDGGITNNPYFVMLNPTLRTHVEAAYRYLQKYHSTVPVTVLRKKGPLEDVIKNYIKDFSESTASVPLELKFVDLIDSFTVKNVNSLRSIGIKVC